MEDKDYIKDLFSEKLQGFEAKVDPSVWSGIQSQMAANTAASASTGIGIGAKIAAVIGGIAIVGTASYFVFSGDKEEQTKVANQTTTEQFVDVEKTQVETISEENSLNEISKKDNISTTEENAEDIAPLQKDTTQNQPSSVVYTPTPDPVLPPAGGGEAGTTPSVPKNQTPPNIPPKAIPLSTVISAEKKDANLYEFKSSNTNVDYVEWNFGDGNYSNEASTDHVYNSPGKYEVQLTVFKGEEKVTVTKVIEIKQAGSIEAYPNVFSPNNDGSNDIFSINSKNIESFNLTLYNKNGEVKFKTDDVNFRWNGENVEDGSYYYVIMATDIDGAMINEYHTLEIIRTRR